MTYRLASTNGIWPGPGVQFALLASQRGAVWSGVLYRVPIVIQRDMSEMSDYERKAWQALVEQAEAKGGQRGRL